MSDSGHADTSPTYTVELTRDELVVLDHWLHTLDQRTDFESLVPTRAERSVFWSLLAQAERLNPDVFAADYAQGIEQAQARLDPGEV